MAPATSGTTSSHSEPGCPHSGAATGWFQWFLTPPPASWDSIWPPPVAYASLSGTNLTRPSPHVLSCRFLCTKDPPNIRGAGPWAVTQGTSSLPTTFQSCRVQLSCHLAQEAGEEAGGALDPRACPHSLLRPTEVSWPSETHGVHGPVLWCVLGERDDHYTMETYSLVCGPKQPVGVSQWTGRSPVFKHRQRGFQPSVGSQGFASTSLFCSRTSAESQEAVLHWAQVLMALPVSSVAQSCPTFCDPMDCSMPGLPVHHQFPEPAQTYAH